MRVRSRALVRPRLPRAWGRGLITVVVLAGQRTNERSCITALFSKESKPSETNDPNAKKMTPSDCFGLSGSYVRSYAHARICRLMNK